MPSELQLDYNSQIKNKPAATTISSATYNFSPATPGGSLSIGSNTISMAVPAGLAVNNYLYISGGTGTAEAVPITAIGGSSVSVTCAHTHSGNWTIQSASAGLQEAIVANPTAMIYLSSGSFDWYGPINFTTTSPGVTGQGIGATVISWHQTALNCLTVPLANTSIVQFSGFYINAVGTQTAGALINAVNEGGATINNVYLQNAWIGIASITFNNKIKVTNSFIYFNYQCISGVFNAGGTELTVSNCDAGGLRSFGTVVAGSAYISMVNASATIDNFWCVNGAVTFGWYFPVGASGIMISNSYIDQFQQYGLYVSDFTLVNVTNTIIEGDWNYPAAPTAQGAFIGSTVNGGEIQISNSHISSGSGAPFAALFIDGPALTDILISNSDFPPLGSGGGSVGIYIKSTGSNSATRVSITGNKAGLGQQSGGVSAAFGFLTGQAVLANWNIQGNDFYGTSAALDIVNYASATNTTIANNNGVDNVIPTVASATTIAAPVAPFASTIILTGTTTVTTLQNSFAGRKFTVLYPSGAGVTVLGRALTAGSNTTFVGTGVSGTSWS